MPIGVGHQLAEQQYGRVGDVVREFPVGGLLTKPCAGSAHAAGVAGQLPLDCFLGHARVSFVRVLLRRLP